MQLHNTINQVNCIIGWRGVQATNQTIQTNTMNTQIIMPVTPNSTQTKTSV